MHRIWLLIIAAVLQKSSESKSAKNAVFNWNLASGMPKRTFISLCCGVKRCDAALTNSTTSFRTPVTSNATSTKKSKKISSTTTRAPTTTITQQSTTIKITTQEVTTTSLEPEETPPPGMINSCPQYTCLTNPSLLDKHGDLKIGMNPSYNGTYRLACGRIYFFSKTSTEAASDCCARNMKLLAIESDKEYQCLENYTFLSQYWLESNYFHAALYDRNDIGNFKWCKGNYSLPLRNDSLLQFYKEQTDVWDSEQEHCAVLLVKARADLPVMQLLYANRDDQAEYICEGPYNKPVPFPTCPDVCEPNESQVQVAKSVLASMETLEITLVKSPNSPTFFKACNGTYFFIEKPMRRGLTWDDAYAECCAYGFQPLSIETEEEFQCIVAHNRETLKLWGFFWTSGTNEGPLSGDHPGWCATRKFAKNLHWPPHSKKPQSLLQFRYLALRLTYGEDADSIWDAESDEVFSVFCEKNDLSIAN